MLRIHEIMCNIINSILENVLVYDAINIERQIKNLAKGAQVERVSIMVLSLYARFA